MKPKKIRVINSKLCSGTLEKGKIYDVEEWDADGGPIIIDEEGVLEPLVKEEWEPVSWFSHGDPVWAWDDGQKSRHKGVYLCPTLSNEDHYVECKFGPDPYQNVEHRKPQMTLQELADKADVNLDEVEIVE